MQLNGAEIVIECLKEQGVDTVFGYPGGAILNVYDELYKHRDEIRHILTSHEQGAAHAADGYARATGKVGVCLATSGPGATNLVTGIATAYMDSIPVVAITCNVGVPLLGKDSFQEIDIAGVTMPITKYSFIVKDVNQLADTIRKAFRIAKMGRPGPVLIDIPKDVTAKKAEYEKENPGVYNREFTHIDEKEVAAAAEMIQASEKPFIFVGGGAILSGASKELKEFVEKTDAPVTDSLMGKGAFPGTDPRYTGMLGMHGTKASNYGVSECDLLVVVGARFSDRVTGNTATFAKNAKILQIDIDPAEMNKNIIIDQGVVGDIKAVLRKLNEVLPQQDHAEWMKKIQDYKEKYPLKYHEGVLTGPFVVEEIYRQTKGDAIITTEVGQHQMWAAQYFKYTKPRTLLTSGGLGTMGYGLGAAIGAKTGCPDKTVINVAGDGCFRMNMNELATAVRHEVPVIEVVINNHVLGMVRQWQDLFYDERYSATVLRDAVDYVKLAEAMGAEGMRATTQEEFREAFAKALASGRPVLIDCMIDCDDKVWPMVAPGAAISEAFDEQDLNRVYNFSAGPAVLPEEVLKEAAAEMLDYNGTGMSVMEMSHRSKAFEEIITAAEQDLRDLMNIPDNYKVLFLQGGASQQFAMIPMNLMKKKEADYIVTGQWAKKAAKEAAKYGKVNVIASSEDKTFSYIPDCSDLPISENADYVYICENNTIYGTKFKELPNTKGKTLVADVSSCFLSEPVDVTKYGVIYGGVQKNIGPAGVVIVIIREDLITEDVLPGTPTMLQYKTHADAGSLYNTPPAYGIYICGKVFKWLKKMGGLEVMKERNEKKAKVLYDYLDQSKLFKGTVVPKDRSLMNVPFVTGDKDLDAKFVKEAKEAGFENLKGHRTVGGMRASIYNAMPYEGVVALVEFMKKFEEENL